MEKNLKNDKIFTTIVLFFIIIFCFLVVKITFQNDTFYTIKVGEQIANNGIDMKDHFSWHENLNYTYPHWLYDLISYKIYNLWGFTGLYITTCLLSSILGLTIFFCNRKLTSNSVASFIVTLFTVFLLNAYITARAQLATFILFALEYYIIERFIQKRKKIYVIILFLISTIMVNIHVAVWPFFFILFLPEIGARLWIGIGDKITNDGSIIKAYEKDINKLEKVNKDDPRIDELKEGLAKAKIEKENHVQRRNEKLKNFKSIIYEKKDNAYYLILVMIICAFCGFLSPLGAKVSYTYLIKTMIGDTTQYILEHLPAVLISNAPLLIYTIVLLYFLIFNKQKFKLDEFFLVLGLWTLAISSARQTSMLILISSYPLTRLFAETITDSKEKYYTLLEKINDNKRVYLYAFIFVIAIASTLFSKNFGSSYVNEELYPVEAVKYIKENLDLNNITLFNEYDYGSYLILNNIPVFIDSRADLYSPEFNKNCTVFDDFMDASLIRKYPEEIFEKYNITHILLRKNEKLYNVVEGSKDYNEIYSDKYFAIFERNKK